RSSFAYASDPVSLWCHGLRNRPHVAQRHAGGSLFPDALGEKRRPAGKMPVVCRLDDLAISQLASAALGHVVVDVELDVADRAELLVQQLASGELGPLDRPVTREFHRLLRR